MVTRVDYNGYYELQNDVGQPHSPDHNTPSFVTDDGTEMWYQHGSFHREYGLPSIVIPGPNGRTEYHVRGWRFRQLSAGPAVIYNDPNMPDEYWQWAVQTDAEGNALPGYGPEEDEWFEVPPFLDDLSDAELGLIPPPPIEDEEQE